MTKPLVGNQILLDLNEYKATEAFGNQPTSALISVSRITTLFIKLETSLL